MSGVGIGPPILTVNRVAFLGGVERVILSAAEVARKHGYRPVLACPAPGTLVDEARRRGLPVRDAPIARGEATVSPVSLARTLAALRRGRREVARIAREEGARLLHTHHPVAALQAQAAARALNVPLLFHVHETLPMPPLYGALARWLRDRCDLFVCVSEASRSMVRSIGVSEERIRLVYNAVDPSYLGSPPRAADVAGPGPHVGLFGVLEPRKGQDDFLRACSLLRDRFPTMQVWVVGALTFAGNARYADGLRQLARDAGIERRVHFTGHRADIPEMMTGMDVVVLASPAFESLPTVLIEACALGRPVVATDVGGVTEIVRDGVTGTVVRPRDPVRLAAAIDRMLSPAGAEMGARARADARARFAPERFAEELIACYEQLLSARQA